jgi:4,5-dihydroxyphthalate decarboxylase
MSKLKLSVAVGPYDRTRALVDGSVEIDGVEAVCMTLPPEEIFFRAFRQEAFDICECSLSSFTVKTSLGTSPYVGVPAFVSRMFRHTSMYCRTDRIKEPKDLKGKRVGVPEYQLTANVWARAILEDDHGVKPSDVIFVRGGISDADRPEKITLNLPKDVRLEEAPEGKTISALLDEGAIDGFVAPRPPSGAAAHNPNIGWLFRDPVAAAKDYYKRTKIFPIMHLVAIKKSVYEKYPFVATSLFNAFQRAKEIALERMYNERALRYMLPWLPRDIDEIHEYFGGDPWPYGVEENRPTLEALVQYLQDQNLTDWKPTLEELFCPIWGASHY